MLDKDDIKIGKIIKFSSEKHDYQIKIDEQRKCYTSEEYDTTIIEIKKEDGININKFLEIDEDIFNDNANEIFSKSSIYIMHYPNGNENQISFGVNKGISLNNINILHQTQTLPGSSGSPIMNLLNYKIIGIHKGEDENRNWNLGTLLKLPIEKFKEEFCNKEDIKNNNNIINQNNSYIKNKENILKNKNEDIKLNNPKKENEFSLFNQILQENIYEDNKNKVDDKQLENQINLNDKNEINHQMKIEDNPNIENYENINKQNKNEQIQNLIDLKNDIAMFDDINIIDSNLLINNNNFNNNEQNIVR